MQYTLSQSVHPNGHRGYWRLKHYCIKVIFRGRILVLFLTDQEASQENPLIRDAEKCILGMDNFEASVVVHIVIVSTWNTIQILCKSLT